MTSEWAIYDERHATFEDARMTSNEMTAYEERVDEESHVQKRKVTK